MPGKKHDNNIVVAWDRVRGQLFQNTDPPWWTVVDMPFLVTKVYLANFLRHQGLTAHLTQTEKEAMGEWTLTIQSLGQIYLAELEGQRTHVSINPPKDSLSVLYLNNYWRDVMEHFSIWLVQVQDELQPPPEKHTTVKPSSPKPHPRTLEKLENLRRIRYESIRNDRVRIGWLDACTQAEIDPDTAFTHDPTLRSRWDDPEYS